MAAVDPGASQVSARLMTCARTARAVQTQEVNPITTATVTAPRDSWPMLKEIRISSTKIGRAATSVESKGLPRGS